MDEPARLPIDCPRCENRGVLALDDDRTLSCPLCNNWCTLCLDGVPTFVQITRPYCGSLITGMRPTIDGERLFDVWLLTSSVTALVAHRCYNCDTISQ